MMANPFSEYLTAGYDFWASPGKTAGSLAGHPDI
jgi:hypothetical protein